MDLTFVSYDLFVNFKKRNRNSPTSNPVQTLSFLEARSDDANFDDANSFHKLLCKYLELANVDTFLLARGVESPEYDQILLTLRDWVERTGLKSYTININKSLCYDDKDEASFDFKEVLDIAYLLANLKVDQSLGLIIGSLVDTSCIQETTETLPSCFKWLLSLATFITFIQEVPKASAQILSWVNLQNFLSPQSNQINYDDLEVTSPFRDNSIKKMNKKAKIQDISETHINFEMLSLTSLTVFAGIAVSSFSRALIHLEDRVDFNNDSTLKHSAVLCLQKFEKLLKRLLTLSFNESFVISSTVPLSRNDILCLTSKLDTLGYAYNKFLIEICKALTVFHRITKDFANEMESFSFQMVLHLTQIMCLHNDSDVRAATLSAAHEIFVSWDAKHLSPLSHHDVTFLQSLYATALFALSPPSIRLLPPFITTLDAIDEIKISPDVNIEALLEFLRRLSVIDHSTWLTKTAIRLMTSIATKHPKLPAALTCRGALRLSLADDAFLRISGEMSGGQINIRDENTKLVLLKALRDLSPHISSLTAMQTLSKKTTFSVPSSPSHIPPLIPPESSKNRPMFFLPWAFEATVHLVEEAVGSLAIVSEDGSAQVRVAVVDLLSDISTRDLLSLFVMARPPLSYSNSKVTDIRPSLEANLLQMVPFLKNCSDSSLAAKVIIHATESVVSFLLDQNPNVRLRASLSLAKLMRLNAARLVDTLSEEGGVDCGLGVCDGLKKGCLDGNGPSSGKPFSTEFESNHASIKLQSVHNLLFASIDDPMPHPSTSTIMNKGDFSSNDSFLLCKSLPSENPRRFLQSDLFITKTPFHIYLPSFCYFVSSPNHLYQTANRLFFGTRLPFLEDHFLNSSLKRSLETKKISDTKLEVKKRNNSASEVIIKNLISFEAASEIVRGLMDEERRVRKAIRAAIAFIPLHTATMARIVIKGLLDSMQSLERNEQAIPSSLSPPSISSPFPLIPSCICHIHLRQRLAKWDERAEGILLACRMGCLWPGPVEAAFLRPDGLGDCIPLPSDMEARMAGQVLMEALKVLRIFMRGEEGVDEEEAVQSEMEGRAGEKGPKRKRQEEELFQDLLNLHQHPLCATPGALLSDATPLCLVLATAMELYPSPHPSLIATLVRLGFLIGSIVRSNPEGSLVERREKEGYNEEKRKKALSASRGSGDGHESMSFGKFQDLIPSIKEVVHLLARFIQ